MKGLMSLNRHLCFLDVGHGNSTVVIAGEDNVVVVDAGRRGALYRFLLEHGITRVRSMYLSHTDADHIGGLVGILATPKISIDNVYVNGDASQDSKLWDDLVYELDRAHQDGLLEFKTELVSGHREELPYGVSIEVLAPSRYLAAKGPGGVNRSGTTIRTNSVSAVIAVSVGASTVALLPGDIDGVGLDGLLQNRQANLNARILVYPHHGGLPGAGINPEEYAKKLLPEVRPDLVIFSIGRGRYSTPSPDVMRQLRKLLPDTRIVCTQLSEHCADQLPAVPSTHLSQAFAGGREFGKCYGGTVVVSLEDVSEIQPKRIPHAEFIKDHAPTALCFEHRPEISLTQLAR